MVAVHGRHTMQQSQDTGHVAEYGLIYDPIHAELNTLTMFRYSPQLH